jgi:hypothetical protein
MLDVEHEDFHRRASMEPYAVESCCHDILETDSAPSKAVELRK